MAAPRQSAICRACGAHHPTPCARDCPIACRAPLTPKTKCPACSVAFQPTAKQTASLCPECTAKHARAEPLIFHPSLDLTAGPLAFHCDGSPPYQNAPYPSPTEWDLDRWNRQADKALPPLVARAFAILIWEITRLRREAADAQLHVDELTAELRTAKRRRF